MAKGNEHTLNELIEAALRRMNFDETVTKKQVEDAYHRVVGDFIDKLTWGVRFDVKSRTLKVSLASPALKQELSFKKTDLMNRINETLRSQVVKEIVFL